MTMAGERGGDARCDSKATTRQRRGSKAAKAARLQRQSAMAPQVAGARRGLTRG